MAPATVQQNQGKLENFRVPAVSAVAPSTAAGPMPSSEYWTSCCGAQRDRYVEVDGVRYRIHFFHGWSCPTLHAAST